MSKLRTSFLSDRSARTLARLFLGGSSLWLAACAEVPFSVHTQDNDLATIKPALTRLQQSAVRQAPQNGSGHAMVFVLAGPEKRAVKAGEKAAAPAEGEKTLIGYDLTEGKQVFSVPADVRSRFAVSRGLLVHREGDSGLVLRDVQTGAVRSRVAFEPGETLAGLTADEEQVYYVTRAKINGENRSFVTALSAAGQRVWRLPAQGSVGAPAAAGGLLALPYRYQDVVVLDAKTGAELTRIRQKDEQIGFVRPAAQGFYYGVGTDGVALLTEKSVAGERDKIAYLAPKLGERVRVFLNWDGYRPEQIEFSAFDRNRLLWDAEQSGEQLRFTGGEAVLHSYRFFFAVDTEKGGLSWAYAQPRNNLMASDLVGNVVLYAAQDGELGALDKKTGGKLLTQKLTLPAGQQVLGATFDAVGYAPSTAQAQRATPLLDVLHNIIFDRDSSFLSVKSFAVQALGNIPGKDSAAELIRVVTADGMPQQIARTAGEVLVKRKDPEVAALLCEALKSSYDYLEDKRPKGLDVLARAAAAVGAKDAVPVLTQRLTDPSTPAPALKEIVAALTQLGGKDVIAPLRESLLMYRSDAAFSADSDAWKRAGEGLLKIGGEGERRTVQFVALEPRTLPPLAEHFTKLLVESAQRPPKAATETPKNK
jgi:outer membrane protein assembly factor BamB